MTTPKLTAEDIVFSVFSLFQQEKERGRLYISIDNLWQRMVKATSLSKSTAYQMIISKLGQSYSASQQMEADATSDEPVLDPLSLRPKCRHLDSFNQALVRRTVFALHSERMAPTLGKVQERINDSIEIS